MGDEQEERVHLGFAPLRGEQAEGVGWAVDPVIVAVDDEESVLSDHRRGLDQPAAGFEQQAALVADRHAEPSAARGKVGLKRVSEIMDVDHDLLDPGGAEAVEDMIDERLSGDFDERFWARCGERAHALAEASGQDHRGSRRRGVNGWAKRHGARRTSHSGFQAAARAEAGTLASNHALTGASAGCARSRSSKPHKRGWNLR